MYDIIPDIHGQAEKLKSALVNLGYRYRNGAWRHSDPNRICVFLGDYVDRGPNNAEVIDIIRRMVDAGTAMAIMGNHELNAIHFHTNAPVTGAPLREHSPKNLRQHASFLKEFPVGDEKTAEAIAWMRSLPLFLELEGFRAVHACWNETTIADLGKLAKNGRLSEEQFLDAADSNTKLFGLVETTTKGPEARMPEGYTIYDKEGVGRKDVRLQWWNDTAASWSDIAISVPDVSQLPPHPLPSSITQDVYSQAAKPVFFGHYWLSGDPALQASNALCLDYSAGRDGPLASYSYSGEPLELSRMGFHEVVRDV